MTGGDFKSYAFYDCIDISVIEAVLKENCGQEVKWLKQVIEHGVWIRGNTGRRIKATKQLAILEKL